MMCQKFGMDKKDLFGFFLNLFVMKNGINERIDAIIEEFEITKLDIQRMQRYLDKCTYPSSESLTDDGDDEECE
jgi:hypothetical protein